MYGTSNLCFNKPSQEYLVLSEIHSSLMSLFNLGNILFTSQCMYRFTINLLHHYILFLFFLFPSLVSKHSLRLKSTDYKSITLAESLTIAFLNSCNFSSSCL